VATTPEQAAHIAAQLGGKVVVKAQVLVGGRGKAGGIKLAQGPQQTRQVAGEILGTSLKGVKVDKVLVEEAADIAAEYYLGFTIDRSAQKDVLMVSSMGGVDIEEVAAATPEKIAKLHIDPAVGLLPFQVRLVAADAGLPPETRRAAAETLTILYRVYVDTDASLAEINPLALTSQGNLLPLDAKIIIDDNALFRQKELAQLREEQEEDALEAEAHRRGLTYVRLQGDIGIIGNGAGLVMTTLDIVQRAGGRPANFLDIGGGARAELVAQALDMVLLDPQVRAVLLNIFGGITRCDEVAKGVLEAIAAREVSVPIVIRLAGTRQSEAAALLAGSPLLHADSMEAAAALVVQLLSSGPARPS